MEATGVYGYLKAVQPLGVKLYGNRPVPFWRFQCLICGRLEDLSVRKVECKPHLDRCYVCRRGPCVICDGDITAEKTRRNVCSDECYTVKRRSQWRDSYHAAKERMDDFNKVRHQRVLDRMEADPEFAEQIRAGRRLASQKYKSAHPEKVRQVHKKYYENNKERVLEKNKRWDDANPERRKEINRESKKRKKHPTNPNPRPSRPARAVGRVAVAIPGRGVGSQSL